MGNSSTIRLVGSEPDESPSARVASIADSPSRYIAEGASRGSSRSPVEGDEAAVWRSYVHPVLLLAIVGLGLFAGAVAQLLLGTSIYKINWAEALVAGLVGSFIGGLLISLLAGDGIRLRASGIVGSIIGAIVVSAVYAWYRRRSAPAKASPRPAARRRR
jgi:uncharacterized membrane protein YeaQ/YmgE (transglycosylase-associated protein family)